MPVKHPPEPLSDDAFTSAVESDNVEFVSRALSRGYSNTTAKHLKYAIEYNQPELFNVLIENKCHADVYCLWYAIRNNRQEMFDVLIENKCPADASCLRCAIKHNRPEIIKRLREVGCPEP